MEKVEGIENAWMLTVEEARRVLNLGSFGDMLVLCGSRIEMWSPFAISFRPMRGSDLWVVGHTDRGGFLLVRGSVKCALESEKQGGAGKA